MKIILLDDQLQEPTTDTCEIFQLYSYKSLFDPVRDSKIIDDEFLTKETVTTLLNEIFSKNKEKNEEEMKLFVRDNDLLTNMYNCIQITSINQQSLFTVNFLLLTSVNLLHVNQSCIFFYREKYLLKKYDFFITLRWYWRNRVRF